MSRVVLKGVIVAAMMASKKEKHLGKLMDYWRGEMWDLTSEYQSGLKLEWL